MRIRISKADSIFSEYIRKKAGWCQACMRIGRLETHHYFGRGHRSVRFDERNAVCLCFLCHRKFHEDPEFGRHFMIKRLGQRQYDNLFLFAKTGSPVKKRDEYLIVEMYKKLLKKLPCD